MERIEFIDKAAAEFAGYCESKDLSAKDSAQLMRNLFDAIADRAFANRSENLIYIEAPNAVVEVIDSESGMLFRRYLELDFMENDNGIKLRGENIRGEETQIVYLSETAIEKLNDLRGQGRDDPRCD